MAHLQRISQLTNEMEDFLQGRRSHADLVPSHLDPGHRYKLIAELDHLEVLSRAAAIQVYAAIIQLGYTE